MGAPATSRSFHHAPVNQHLSRQFPARAPSAARRSLGRDDIIIYLTFKIMRASAMRSTSIAPSVIIMLR